MLENQHPAENTFISRINKFFIFLLLAYLPVSELFIHALESYSGFSDNLIFWLSHFYEPLIVALIILNLVTIFIKKNISYSWIDIAALAFVVWSLVCVFIHPSQLQRGLESLRFTVFPFLVYIYFRSSGYANAKKIALFYLGVAGVISTIGVIEYFFFPANWLTSYFGISNFGFGQNALASTNQASSFLAGPNQLASYLIFPLFYSLHLALESKRFFRGWTNYFIAPITLALILTFSRSAILGTSIGILVFFLTLPKERRSKIPAIILFLVASFALVVSYVMYFGGTITDLLTHGASTAQHAISTQSATKTAFGSNIVQILFGQGIGTAGPAALKFGGYMPENFYLQIIFETGIVGFLFFSAFFIFSFRKFYSGSKLLFVVSIALLVNAFFLHIFSDNPAMATSIFALMAVAINVDFRNKAVGYNVPVKKQ